jgi:hypothetical protein
LGRELNYHFDMQLAKVARTAPHRHSFVLYYGPAKRLGYLPRAHCDLVPVQVRHVLCEAHQGLFQSELQIDEQVVPYALENRMRRLLDYKSDVTLNHVWPLLALPLKDHCVAGLHAPLHVHMEGLGFRDHPTPAAAGTLLSEYFSLALAGAAWLLHLHLHHAHVDFLGDLAGALAGGTGLEVAPLGPAALALGTVDVALHRKLGVGPHVQLLQSRFDRYFVVRALLSVVPALFEPFDFLFALLVVYLPLRFIRQNLVRPGYFGEFACRLLVPCAKFIFDWHLPGFLSGWYRSDCLR